MRPYWAVIDARFRMLLQYRAAAIAGVWTQLFFGFYWLSTGIHGLHLMIGVGLVARLVRIGWRDPGRLPGSPQVEVATLYWGFVDMVWLFLYPALYLVGRAG